MIFNNTALTKYEDCPRLFYLEEVLRLMKKPRDEDAARNIDREQGVLWHELMDIWRRHGRRIQPFGLVGEEPEYTKAERKADVTAHLKVYYNARINAAEFEEEKLFEIECEKYMQGLFDAYVERYPTDSFEIVATEQDFITCLGDACPECGEPYHEDLRRGMTIEQRCACGAEIDYLVGRVDLITSENGCTNIVDYKTKKASRSPSDHAMNGYAVGSQFTTYMYGAGRVLARTISKGVVDIVVKLKNIAEKGNPFKRNEEIVKGPLDYEMFVKDRQEMLRQIREDLARLDENGSPKPGTYPFRRNTNHCYQYGPCPMVDICHPARDTWWAPPTAKVSEYTIRPATYVDDYRALIEEEIE